MTLIRWSPTRELTTFPFESLNMQREINRMFDNFFRGGIQDDGAISFLTPAVDIAEGDSDYTVRVELPGVSKDDVKITMQDNILTIRGEKKLVRTTQSSGEEKEARESNYHRTERSFGSFQRSFTLPTHVKSDKIEATYKDGILTVTLPKAEEAKPKQIEVKVK